MYKNLIELSKENEGKGAVGAFNLHCFEMLPAMIQAAEELNVPIIIQTSLGTAEYIGFEPLIAAVKALAEKSSVNVALHMDHCKSIEALKKAIPMLKAQGYEFRRIEEKYETAGRSEIS